MLVCTRGGVKTVLDFYTTKDGTCVPVWTNRFKWAHTLQVVQVVAQVFGRSSILWKKKKELTRTNIKNTRIKLGISRVALCRVLRIRYQGTQGWFTRSCYTRQCPLKSHFYGNHRIISAHRPHLWLRGGLQNYHHSFRLNRLIRVWFMVPKQVLLALR